MHQCAHRSDLEAKAGLTICEECKDPMNFRGRFRSSLLDNMSKPITFKLGKRNLEVAQYFIDVKPSLARR